jgi:hypothetical protein
VNAPGVTAELRAWRRVRRFAVPPEMIEAATARREAGDWRGACAAAGVDVDARDKDLAPFADDLRHLAPDLLRWHLPRDLPTTALADSPVPLAVREDATLVVMPRYPGRGNQRLVLRLARTPSPGWESFVDSRERWDARHAGRLAAPDGALLELQDRGDHVAAFAAAGFDVSMFSRAGTSAYALNRATEQLRNRRYDLGRLASAVRAIAHREGVAEVLIAPGLLVTAADLTLRYAQYSPGVLGVPPVLMLRPVDFDLVRAGLLTPADLHPLVAAALFPGAVGAPARPAPDLAPIRVWCRGGWHVVEMREGRTITPHDPDELRREQALHALGGPPLSGCFAALLGWRGARLRFSKHLRLRRRDVLEHATHGDAAGLAAWLAAGVDRTMRDGQGRTLLHLLSWLPAPGGLAGELVAAGLDLEARDDLGRTPLLHAVAEGGSEELIRALLALGARPDGWVEVAQRSDRGHELWPLFAG